MKKIHRLRQDGVIFLVLMFVLFVTASTLVIGALNNRQTAVLARNVEVRYQMEQAKAALLAYAANYARLSNNAHGPGFFPCPNTDNDPSNVPEPTSCTSDVPVIGRLPEYEVIAGSRFVFNDVYSDIDDEELWYVVAPRYLYSSTSTNRLSYLRTYADPSATFASNYWLKLDDEPEYVALIIAPGEELEDEDRSAGPTNYANYLDGQNGGDGFNFYTSYSSNPVLFNDQILGITLDEYMVHVGTAVARDVKTYLDAYNKLPGNTYPADSGSMYNTTVTGTTSAICSNSTSATFFRRIFDSNTYGAQSTWLRDHTSGNNGERWSCPYGLYWNRLTNDVGELKFNGCPNLKFTFTYSAAGGSLVRDGEGC